MQQIIYFNNKPLYLVSEISQEVEEFLHHEETVFIDEFNQHTVKAMIHEMEQPQIIRGVFLHHDINALLNAFKKKLHLIKAAGGFVYTEGHEVLMIFRRGKWDLPKGKLDEGEDLPTCAIREVREETGLETLEMDKPLAITYHTYHQFGEHIIKESHWYLIKSPKQETFKPQTEEDIERCEWVPVTALNIHLDNTHASIRDVVHAGVKLLNFSAMA
ncbi:MAG TPA: NUDIX domain-containing protein [Flavisolibacter sp.]|nr:NUDIX domain-containing protein [Flavisolibacter sp.]